MPFACAFSPDGAYFISASGTGNAALWRVSPSLSKTVGPTATLALHDDTILSLKFGLIDGLVLCSGSESCVRCWDWTLLAAFAEAPGLSPPAPLATFVPRGGSGTAANSAIETNDLCLDETRGLIFTANGDSVIRAWSFKTHQLVREYVGHAAYVHCLALRAGGATLISGSEDGTVRLWESESGKVTAILDTASCSVADLSFRGHPGGTPSNTLYVRSLLLSSDETWLFVGTGQSVILLWHIPSLACCKALPIGSVPQCLALAPRGEIVCGGTDGCLTYWTFGGDLVRRVPPASNRVLFTVAVHPKHPLLAAGGDSAAVDVFVNPTNVAFSLPVS
eukprot:TRINITY_DN4778_c0_g1_i1.p1 TRINITY_DN4778_c0_g1~~TRINITY_DN4778_c0_g1_i1.p1  ORF type:complete len:335 (+),score=47.25 TRINITY_DN4778_c0_g1_i1:195-1199(+)